MSTLRSLLKAAQYPIMREKLNNEQYLSLPHAIGLGLVEEVLTQHGQSILATLQGVRLLRDMADGERMDVLEDNIGRYSMTAKEHCRECPYCDDCNGCEVQGCDNPYMLTLRKRRSGREEVASGVGLRGLGDSLLHGASERRMSA